MASVCTSQLYLTCFHFVSQEYTNVTIDGIRLDEEIFFQVFMIKAASIVIFVYTIK